MKKLKVYIAGPVHGSGTQANNIARALEAAEMVRKAGCVPFVPHLYMLWEMVTPGQDQNWLLDMCLEWVAACDVFVRIDGKSPGSELEEAHARVLKKPCFKREDPYIGDELTGVRRFIAAYQSGRLSHVGFEYETVQRDVSIDILNDNNDLKRQLDALKAAHDFSAQERLRLVETNKGLNDMLVHGASDAVIGDLRRKNEILEDRLHDRHTDSNLGVFQEHVAMWRAKQPFAKAPSHTLLLGVMEEVGELSHAHLKTEQGIRGTKEEHDAKKRDAIGDILVFLAGYCEQEGFQLEQCRQEAWDQVKDRDWTLYPLTGKPTEAVPSRDAALDEVIQQGYSKLKVGADGERLLNKTHAFIKEEVNDHGSWDGGCWRHNGVVYFEMKIGTQVRTKGVQTGTHSLNRNHEHVVHQSVVMTVTSHDRGHYICYFKDSTGTENYTRFMRHQIQPADAHSKQPSPYSDGSDGHGT